MAQGVDFELSDELKMLQRTVRDFAQREVMPTVEEDDRAHRFRRDLVARMGGLGFLGCPIPEEYGGNGMGFLAHALCCEEIGRVSGSLGSAFNMQCLGTSYPILKYGTEGQRRRYIPALVSGRILGCMGITEPEAGADTGAIATTAAKDGDFYVLNGSKTWISYAPVADVSLLYAYTDKPRRYKGMSAFIVELDTPGITRRPIEDKLGWHGCPTGQLFFEDARVPATALVGREGEGFAILMDDLATTRISIAGRSVGACQAFLDEAVKYANQRHQFGQAIGQFQMIQEMIARMVVDTEAARLLAYRCAYLKDKGQPVALESAQAKLFASEAASRSADLALQILGAYGYSGEYPVARMFRDAKLFPIVEGSVNVQKVIIATDALGYRQANR